MDNETKQPTVSNPLERVVVEQASTPKIKGLEIEMCECCTCGFKWQKGKSGSHSCSKVLSFKLELLKNRMEPFILAAKKMKEFKHDKPPIIHYDDWIKLAP